MEQLKKDFKKWWPLLVAIMIVIMAFRESAAADPNRAKHDPNKQLVCVHLIFDVIVEDSPSLVFTIKKPGELIPDQTPCSTTGGGRPESGCKFTRRMFVHDGDEITVNIHRAFTLNSTNERRMFHAVYPIVAGMGTDPKNESFTDPHGHGRGRVHVAVGDPSTCQPSKRR